MARAIGRDAGRAVETAEATGFDAISVTDHVWGSQYTGGVDASQVEAYTTLGFIAARTRRVRLLTLASAASYRHPGLLAKTVTTLNVLSGGRATLGIGAGDYAEEPRASASRFRPQPSATTCSRRRSRPACACGRASKVTSGRSTARTYRWRGH